MLTHKSVVDLVLVTCLGANRLIRYRMFASEVCATNHPCDVLASVLARAAVVVRLEMMLLQRLPLAQGVVRGRRVVWAGLFSCVLRLRKLPMLDIS